MTITLYSGVELRSDYSIVFDTDTGFWGTNTPFKRYLDDKAFYTEELDDVYFSNDGSISISWPVYRRLAENITYMRIFTEQNEIKYFFVNSYEYHNEVLVLNYTLDVWHTYSNSMNIHFGTIDRARYIPEDRRKTLPMSYETNKSLVYDEPETKTFYLIAEYQVYRLVGADDTDLDPNQISTERFSFTAAVSHRDIRLEHSHSTTAKDEFPPSESVQLDSNFEYTIDEAIETINNLTAYQGTKPLTEYRPNNMWGANGVNTSEPGTHKASGNMALYNSQFSKEYKPNELRYELVQVFTVPKNLFKLSSFNVAAGVPVDTTIKILDTVEVTGATVIDAVFNFKEYHFAQILNPTSYTTYDIPADPTIIGVGLPSLYLPIAYNGLPQQLRIESQITPFGFNMYIVGHEGLGDIIKHFAVPLPFTTTTGVEKQLAALNKENANRQKWATGISAGLSLGYIISPALGFAGTMIGTGISQITATMGATKGESLRSQLTLPVQAAAAEIGDTAASTWEKAKGSWSAMGGAKAMLGSGASFLYGMNAHLNALTTLKQPVATGTASDSDPVALLNAALGFSTYSLEPVNEREIDYLISRIGYNTWIDTNDYHLQDKEFYKDKYEPISFATAQISGKFPNNISVSLEQILLQGTLISYDPDIFNKL